MKIKIISLDLRFNAGNDSIIFDEVNYFYGKMGAGKTSIALLIDYCLGGDIKLSPAMQNEFVAAKLNISVGDNRLSLERFRSSDQIVASWTSEKEELEVVIPAKKADGEVLPGSGIENVSDLLFYLYGMKPPKVRKSKKKEDSDLERLSIRNLLWYCYLDQDSMDSSFFNLDTEAAYYLRNQSKDVLRYVVGFHQEEVAELETELQLLHDERIALQAGAGALQKALSAEGISEKENIEFHMSQLSEELNEVKHIIATSRQKKQQSTPHAADLLRQKARQMFSEMMTLEDSIRSLEDTIAADKRHLNELTVLKIKYKRMASAKSILGGVEFVNCPRCSQPLSSHGNDVCQVCGQPEQATTQKDFTSDVVEADTSGRVAELSEIIERYTVQLKMQRLRYEELSEEKRKTDQLISEALEQYDSAYLSSTLEYERRKAEIEQTLYKLSDYLRLLKKVDEEFKRASTLEAQEIDVRRRLKEARKLAESDNTNLAMLEKLFLDCLLRARLSGFSENDQVAIRPPHFLPEVISSAVGNLSVTSFANLSSGGKKSLFKACFAIAFHRLAIKIGAVLPAILIIDSPMKNISERENREQFEGFHDMLYELADTELRETQIILIDKEFHAPPSSAKFQFSSRHMTPDQDDNPPLIQYYRGH